MGLKRWTLPTIRCITYIQNYTGFAYRISIILLYLFTVCWSYKQKNSCFLKAVQFMGHVYGAAYASKCCLWLHINELNPLFLLWQRIILSEMAIFQTVMMAYMKRLWENNFSQRRWWFQDFWFLQIAKTVIVSNMKKKICHCNFFLQ